MKYYNNKICMFFMLVCCGYASEMIGWSLTSIAQKVKTESVASAKIMASCIVAATLYGVTQDQITYRHCPDYFDQGFHKNNMNYWTSPDLKFAKSLYEAHPDNPTLRAAIWGVVASWWMGAIIGVPVTLACRIGSWPQLECKDIVKPLACTMGLTGVSAFFAGLQAHMQMNNIDQSLLKYWFAAKGVNVDGVTDWHGFFTDANAHTAAYAAGPLWSLGLMAYILKARYELHKKLQEEEKNVSKSEVVS